MSPKENDNNLKEVYEQYWLHARHVADERLWFTNVYVLVVVGVLVFLRIDQPLFLRLGVVVFVLLLSIAGFHTCPVSPQPFIVQPPITKSRRDALAMQVSSSCYPLHIICALPPFTQVRLRPLSTPGCVAVGGRARTKKGGASAQRRARYRRRQGTACCAPT